MPTSTTHVRVHTKTSFANPWLACDQCHQQVQAWHNPDLCGCERASHLIPCGHPGVATSLCWSWSPVDGCTCILTHRFGER